MSERYILEPDGTRPVRLEALKTLISRLAPNKRWSVEIKEHKERRSDAQNRYLWGVCYAKLEEVTGQEAADWHEFMLGERYGWEATEMMGRKKLKPIRRSSTMDKETFADFVAFIQRKSGEHGIYIPDPNEF